MENSNFYTVRDGLESDTAFIISSWLKSLYYGNSWFSLMPKQVFLDNYRFVLMALLPKSSIKVACLKDTPEVILGYVVSSKDETVIHFAYVKKDFRKIGVARLLAPKQANICTHTTASGLAIIKNKGWIFNPFLI